jgi:bacteriocin-like protein
MSKPKKSPKENPKQAKKQKEELSDEELKKVHGGTGTGGKLKSGAIGWIE